MPNFFLSCSFESLRRRNLAIGRLQHLAVAFEEVGCLFSLADRSSAESRPALPTGNRVTFADASSDVSRKRRCGKKTLAETRARFNLKTPCRAFVPLEWFRVCASAVRGEPPRWWRPLVWRSSVFFYWRFHVPRRRREISSNVR